VMRMQTIPVEKEECLWDWPLQAHDGIVKVHNDEDKFEVHLDVPFFTPKEIQVTVQNGLVDIHAEHEKRPGHLGDVSRSISRAYQLPDDVNETLVRSHLTPRGILIITAIKKPHLSWPERVVLFDKAWVGKMEE
ncbi:hypothetical protein PMAYCL1PPCAC_14814, partial [Pristionchus mayeri]